jgi:UDP-N-acetylmuramoylalanine--D-glutamate ligase
MTMTVALNHLSGRSIGVFGLARSGLATVRAAAAGGASAVYVWDDKAEAREQAVKLGGCAVEPENWPWKELDRLILSPGVPLTHPKPHAVVGLAQSAGVGIVSDIELLWCEADGRARFVAITGTNGKSTTTALIGHVLASAGMKVSVGGNIGRAALDLEEPEEGRVYVLEMSSYQLDLTRYFHPDVAVWLNLTPDHLDRHGDMAGYRGAKSRIFTNMDKDDTALVGIDEPEMEEVAAELQSAARPRLRTVSVARHAEAGLYVDCEGILHENGQPVASLTGLPTLRGAHNWQNAAMAFGAARALGLDEPGIIAALKTFPGLAHRMEIVGKRGSVLFVNDSKATNADAVAKALAAFEPIYWIAGGLPKTGGIESVAPHFKRVAKAYLIGAGADEFSRTLARKVPHVIAGDLATAVAMAAWDASLDRGDEPVVLLTPACASFDQFADYEARGEAFRSAFQALEEQKMEQVA